MGLADNQRRNKQERRGEASNSLSIEERCELIEMLGGVFYTDPKICPYLDLP